MRRSVPIFVILLLVPTLVFSQRMRAAGPRQGAPGVVDMFGPMPMSANAVTGIVTSVSGNLISLASGLVVIDATDAKIAGPDAGQLAVSAIAPGNTIFAFLKQVDVAADAPLPAAFIGVAKISDVTISGPVQSVDLASKSFRVLGRTVSVTAQTRFGGMHDGPIGLADLKTNEIVVVMANATGAGLVAESVQVMSLMPLPVARLHGTVKSIGNDAWVLTDAASHDITIAVNAETKIVGAPVVGSPVDVLAVTDSSNRYVALSIIRSDYKPVPPPQMANFHGSVKSIGPSSWVVRDDDSRTDRTFAVNDKTVIEPGIAVNDRVAVMAIDKQGILTAVVIMRWRM